MGQFMDVYRILLSQTIVLNSFNLQILGFSYGFLQIFQKTTGNVHLRQVYRGTSASGYLDKRSSAQSTGCVSPGPHRSQSEELQAMEKPVRNMICKWRVQKNI
jgi:hypothetical protein